MTAPQPSGTVTFLFTDIEGSTTRWEHHRAAMARALESHNARLLAAMDAHGGFVFKTMGDAFCVAFADPAAALAAALDAQRAIAAEDWTVFAPDFPPLRVRMALHTGPVELRDGDYVGPPVNRVARLMSAAHGGQVLLSLATQQLVRDDLPTGVALHDLGLHRLRDLRHSEHIYRVVADGLPRVDTAPATAEKLADRPGPASEVDLLPAECPYRGLHAFREADAAFFFGREAFTELLVESVAAAPMVGVIGPSGSGKSSVVFAGLVPRLRANGGAMTPRRSKSGVDHGDHGWTVVEMRPGSRPYHALAGALVPFIVGDNATSVDRLAEVNKLAGYLRDGTIAPADVLAQIGEQRPDIGRLLLVADQFEELYTLCADDGEQRAFQDTLFAAAFESGGISRLGRDRGEGHAIPLTLALTLRADFMGHALAYRPFADAIQKHDVKLGPMNRDELARAIRLPAEAQGRAFEHGLVERIADDVGEKAGTLPLLEFALTKLWDHQEAGWLTHAAYEAIGRVEGAVARHADAVYDALGEPEHERARRVFVQLVQPGEGTEDTRRLATKDELGEDWALARKLADARLVTTGRDESGHETAEVVHEALIRSWGRLREWMNADRRFRMWQERLRFSLRQWEAAGRDEGALLRGVPLAEAEQWQSERGAEMTAGERTFVGAGVALRARREAEKEAQRARELEAARQLAEAERMNAETAQRLLAEQQRAAHALRRRAVFLAGALAVAGVLAVGVVLFAWQATEGARRSQSLALAANSRALLGDQQLDPALVLGLEAVSGGTDLPEAELALAEAAFAPGTRLTITGHMTEVKAVAYSPDGKLLLTGARDGGVRLWDAETGAEVRRFVGHSSPVNGVAFMPDGRAFVTGSEDAAAGSVDRALVMWNAASGAVVRRFPGNIGAVRDLAITPDGRWLLATADDGIRKWDVATGQEVAHYDKDKYLFEATVAAAPDSRTAIAGDNGTGLTAWDLESDQPKRRLKGAAQGGSRALAISPDGTMLASVWEARLFLSNIESDTLLHELRGHSNQVYALAFAPDGSRLLSASVDGVARVWDVSTGVEVRRLIGHDGAVRAIAVAPDGRAAATGSDDGTVRVWSLESPALFRRLEQPGELVYSVALSPDGRLALSGSSGGTARLWDVTSGRELQRLAGHDQAVWRVAFTPDGRRAITASWDRTVDVWDVPTGRRLNRMRFLSQLFALAVHPNGRLLLIGGEDGVPVLRNLETGDVVRSTALGDGVRSAAFAPDGGVAVMGTYGGSVWVWDMSGQSPLRRLDQQHAGLIPNLAVSPDGRTVASVSVDRTLCVHDLAPGGRATCRAFNSEMRSVDFTPDGRHVVLGNAAGEVLVWDLRRQAVVRRYLGHTEPVRDTAISADGGTIASASMDGTVRLWRAQNDLAGLISWTLANRHVAAMPCAVRDAFRAFRRCGRDGAAPPPSDYVIAAARSGEDRAEPPAIVDVAVAAPTEPSVPAGQPVRRIANGGTLWDIAVSPDGVHALTASERAGGAYDNVVRLWDLRTGRDVWRAIGHSVSVTSVAYGRDGREAVSADQSGVLVWWDAVSGKAIRRLATGTSTYDLAASADGRRLIIGGYQAKARIIDWATGNDVQALSTQCELEIVISVALSPDGRTALTGCSGPGPIQVWDVDTGAVSRRLEGHLGNVSGLAFSGDGRRAVSSAFDGKVILWNLEDGAELGRFTGHHAPVWGVALNAGGDRVLSGSEDGTLRLWDVATGHEVRRYAAHPQTTQPVAQWLTRGLAFGPDGTWAVSARADGSIVVWDIAGGEPGSAPRAAEAPDAPPATATVTVESAGLMAPGTRSGDLPSGGGVAWRVEGRRDMLLDVAVKASTPAGPVLDRDEQRERGLLDVRLIVRAPDGAVLAENDDTMGGLDSDARVDDVALPQDGQYSVEIRAAADRTGGAYTVAVTGTRLVRPLRSLGVPRDLYAQPARAGLWGLAVTPDGTTAVTGSGSDTNLWVVPAAQHPLTLWNVASGEVVRQLDPDAHTDAIRGVAVSPDGKWLATAAEDTQVILWDMASGHMARRLLEHGGQYGQVYDVAFSPDGKRLLSASADRSAILWDVETGTLIRRFTVADTDVAQARFLPDGRAAVVASGGQLLRLDLETGIVTPWLRHGDATVHSLAVSPDGAWALSGSGDGSLVAWDLANGEEIQRVRTHPGRPIYGVAVSPDGRHGLSGGEDTKVRLWDLRAGVELARLLGHTEPVMAVAFTPDGSVALSTSLDGTLKVWDIADAMR